MFALEKDGLVGIESFLDFLIATYQLATVGEGSEHTVAIGMKGYNDFAGKDFLEAVVKSCVSSCATCFVLSSLFGVIKVIFRRNLAVILPFMYSFVILSLAS